MINQLELKITIKTYENACIMFSPEIIHTLEDILCVLKVAFKPL